jgi:biopolymer transport protein ExbB
MDLTSKFLAFTLLGAQWVLWLLIGLSVLSVAVMIERLLYFARRKVDLAQLIRDVQSGLRAGTADATVERYRNLEAMEAIVATTGLLEAKRGPGAAAEAMTGARAREKLQLERRVSILGTLGNNAPFIGLFGTVLGIIKAFNDLSENQQAGAQTVMKGISEALVATAVGLMVAIPAVLAFNYFMRRVRTTVANADSVAHVILAELRAEGGAPQSSKEAA